MLLRNGTVIAGKRRMDQARKHSSFLRPNEWLMDCGGSALELLIFSGCV